MDDKSKAEKLSDQRWYDKQRAKKASRKYEMSTVWAHRSQAVRRYNPICQAIKLDGKQCTNPSTMCHHLISPDLDWNLRGEWSNLVALCDKCHPRTTGDYGQQTYVPTKGMFGAVYPHAAITPPKGGRLAPLGTPGTKIFIATSQGDEKLSAGLDDASIDDLLEGI